MRKKQLNCSLLIGWMNGVELIAVSPISSTTHYQVHTVVVLFGSVAKLGVVFNFTRERNSL